jgi:hypothetical protein
MYFDGLDRARLNARMFLALEADPRSVPVLAVFDLDPDSGSFWIGRVGIVPIRADQFTETATGTIFREGFYMAPMIRIHSLSPYTLLFWQIPDDFRQS